MKVSKKYLFLLKKSKKSKFLKFFLFLIFLFFTFILFLLSYLLYIKLITPLPNVEELKKIKFSQASIIYDRYWKELYKIFKEKRVYVKFDDISKNMINAIVAWEDKRFWTNPWYDFFWIVRAIFMKLKWWTRVEWTSWITQQLVKNIFLNNERTLERKLRELYLSIEITKKYSKKFILELYLNKTFFWWNSYWVEEASLTFFGVWAKNLNVLQSAILASLPKAPTSLSPYINKWKLLWFLEIINNKNKSSIKILSRKSYEDNKKYIDNFIKIIKNLTLEEKNNDFLKICNIKKDNYKIKDKIKNGCLKIKYNSLNKFLSNLIYKNWDLKISYIPWRKDYILYRMLQDNYITFWQYKKAIIDSFGFEFKPYRDSIKYPYFVMYIKNFLVKKFWEDFLKTWWLKIYTTIDSKIQDKVQKMLEEQVKYNKKKFWAENAAVIILRNKDNQILTYIWWVNYFDNKIWWNNDMLLARLQPWSTFKPFIYALAMQKNNYTKDTIITDNKIVFPWWYSPHNADWMYLGKMTLTKALEFSRNIPAVKLYYAAGWEEKIIEKLKDFWMYNLEKFKKDYEKKYWIKYNYSAPMALGTVQITPLELVWAYSVFANSWIKKEIKPILKILDYKWNKIDYDWKYLNQKQVLEEKYANMIFDMLSDVSKRPKDWNYFLEIKWLKLAVKTWTSTKEFYSKKRTKDSKGRLYRKKIIIPRNLWTVWFTKDYTVLVWVWNTNWKWLKGKAYWITWAAPLMKKIMKFLYWIK